MDDAVVTLDVLHSGIVWGWYVTMNLWAKSISTGAVLVGAWAASRHPAAGAFYARWAPVLGFLFLNVTLLFTVADLHQPWRFWHLFVYANPTSAVAWAGWLLTAYNVALAAVLFFGWRKDPATVGRLRVPVLVLAFLSTIYTAALLGQANAREIWSTPTEIAQTLLSAGLAGSAAFLLFPRPDAEERASLARVLSATALVSGTIFAAELLFAPMKSEEAKVVVGLMTHGEVAAIMLPGLALAFAVPLALSWLGVRSGNPLVLRFAAASALVGLWLVKHAFLVAPQLLPLS